MVSLVRASPTSPTLNFMIAVNGVEFDTSDIEIAEKTWNHLAIYIDKYTGYLRVSVNQRVVATKVLTQGIINIIKTVT